MSQVWLTLEGDSDDIPWRILDMNVLVQGSTGESGWQVRAGAGACRWGIGLRMLLYMDHQASPGIKGLVLEFDWVTEV